MNSWLSLCPIRSLCCRVQSCRLIGDKKQLYVVEILQNYDSQQTHTAYQKFPQNNWNEILCRLDALFSKSPT